MTRQMTRENVADILCIGAQRSMTSWLHHVLAAHPETSPFPNFNPVTSTSKEAHFWDWNRHRGIDWYRRLMRPWNDAHKTLDFTPEYAFLTAQKIAECKSLNPSAKVIYILRDPMARAMSALRMHTLWAIGGDAPENTRITYDTAFTDRCRNARLWQHAAYCDNIYRWRAAYPDMLILNFEELRADPVAGAEQVMDFCGLNSATLEDEQRADLKDRAQQVIWKTPAFPFHPDCLHFLSGMTDGESARLNRDFGFQFSETQGLLEAAA